MRAKILGDFQTPLPLVREILATLWATGIAWDRVLEPTCGTGNFIRGLLELEHPPREIMGIELQAPYAEESRSLTDEAARRGTHLRVIRANLFEMDLGRDIQWNSQAPLLVVGNPPWVTNATLGALNGDNLPPKSNFKRLRGIDALTGASNFDIAEYIWIKLLTELVDTGATIALLCKTSVARNLLVYAHDAHLPVADAAIRRIDARQWFGAGVDACLFTLTADPAHTDYQIRVFSSLTAASPQRKIGFAGLVLVSDIAQYRSLAFLDGASPFTWRQGVKHDAASVMELVLKNGVWKNGLGETVAIEEEYLYPLVKSSDLHPRSADRPTRAVIVPQTQVGQDTAPLQYCAPELWAYLNRHKAAFAKRKSTIYRGKAPFSIFGVGDYAFARYKVVVSGLYKRPHFVLIGPRDGKPVLCDDTCYQLAFDDVMQAALVAAALNHPLTTAFIESIVFWDAKRPITKKLLSRIDIEALLRHLPTEEINRSAEQILSECSGCREESKRPIEVLVKPRQMTLL